ncbi:MAG TPA: universal stress protein [Streptosporangiaceae bacterium]|jgi:nucleotide-binding universal stress UspA family protein
MIVVGVDGSSSAAAALLWAARQARVTAASLRVVTAWRFPPDYGDDVVLTDDWQPDQAARQIQADALTAAASQLDGIESEALVVEGTAGSVLVAESRDADLLVVGSRGHRELAGLLLGSVSEYCTAHAGCSVVVVRPHPAAGH